MPGRDGYSLIREIRAVDPAHTNGIAPVFLVAGIADVVERLARHGIHFPDGVVRSQIGSVARFEATTGHRFYLYEPSAEAMQWPSGAKLKAISKT